MKGKTYITFGFGHVHSVNGKTFDRDSIAQINNTSSLEEGREMAVEIFGRQWHNSYFNLSEHELNQKAMQFYPRGVIEVNPMIGDGDDD